MHSTEPEKARPEGVEGEVFSTFNMAGTRGNLRTVITPEDVLLESNNGNFLRLSHNKVEGMRHHQFHIIPHWCGAIAMLMIYASIRILTGQMQIWVGLIGAGIIISWLGFRKSALTIDSGEGGTFTLFGNDTELIKFRVIADRVRDGIPFENAIEGVEEVIMSEYPSSSVFDELVETIETETNEKPDALSMAMADLINKSKDDEQLIQNTKTESSPIPIEIDEQISVNREPLHHGSISRARRIQSELRTPPAHSGWANVANRTEILRSDANEQPFSNEISKPITTQTQDESFNMFGFDFDESESKEEPFNMFGDAFESTIIPEENIMSQEPRSSFSMIPETQFKPNPQNIVETREPSKSFINSFQQTGFSNPINQLGSTLNSYEEVTTTEFKQPNLPGIVSQAKQEIKSPNENELVNKDNTEGLKRIKLKDGKRQFKRLKPKNSKMKRLTMWGMLKSSLPFKTPEFLRNRTLDANNESESNEFVIDRTMDALKIQAHQTHEAQLADALRKIHENNDESSDYFLEEISPDLVEQKLPSSFQDFKASNDDKKNILSTTGITRLD
ncbi:MAG: Uncharacterised protein [Methanobacteriota archaeon]|nr:MAG: Uncharacterised protein [Euryarchaeota archaeon]